MRGGCEPAPLLVGYQCRAIAPVESAALDRQTRARNFLAAIHLASAGIWLHRGTP
jgi:hypothetical protein